MSHLGQQLGRRALSSTTRDGAASSSHTVSCLQSILQTAAVPYAHGGKNVNVVSKGIGGSWPLLEEASQVPGFAEALRSLVSETYPRHQNLRSGLDQVLQRLLVSQPHLADLVVGPVLTWLGGPGAGMGAGTGAEVPSGSRGGVSAGAAAAGPGRRAAPGAEAAGSGAREGGMTALTARAGSGEEAVEAVEAGQMAIGVGEAEHREEKEEDEGADEGDGKAQAVGEIEAAPADEAGAAARPSLYDSRLLPLSWLLQCLGEVSPALRCLWPQPGGSAGGLGPVEAHILAAAARTFHELHSAPASAAGSASTTTGDGCVTVSYIPESAAVRFVRDCFAAAPPHARLRLLEDAVALTSAPPPSPPAAAGCRTAVPQEANGRRNSEGNELTDELTEPAAKRRRLAEAPSDAAAGGLGVIHTDRRVGFALGTVPPRIWAALLAHVCEEEEGDDATGRKPRWPSGPRVLSPLTLTELLLARGDLFSACDVEPAAPTLLRCLAALSPRDTADLLSRVLSTPASARGPGVEGTRAERETELREGPRGGPHEGHLAAVLSLLRAPIPASRMLLPLRRDPAAVAAAMTAAAKAVKQKLQQPGQKGKKKKLSCKDAAAAKTAEKIAASAVPMTSVAAPPPLTALWTLTHVLPPLMRLTLRLLPEGGGGGGLDGSETGPTAEAWAGGDTGTAERAAAVLIDLLRAPRLLLPDHEPSSLLVAARVMALQIGNIATAEAQAGAGVTAGTVGAGQAAFGGGHSGPERRLAAAICAAMGLSGVPGGGAGSHAGGNPGMALATALCHPPGAVGSSSDSTQGFQISNTHRADAVEDTSLYRLGLAAAATVPPPDTSTTLGARVFIVPGSCRHCNRQQCCCGGGLWPRMRPLLALLDHLPAGGIVAGAVRAALLAALLQGHGLGPLAESDSNLDRDSDLNRARSGAMEGPAAGIQAAGDRGGAGEVWVRGGMEETAQDLERGVIKERLDGANEGGEGKDPTVAATAAVQELLGLLVVEGEVPRSSQSSAAALGSGPGQGLAAIAAAAAAQSAVRLSPTVKVEVLRLLVLAATAAERTAGGGDTFSPVPQVALSEVWRCVVGSVAAVAEALSSRGPAPAGYSQTPHGTQILRAGAAATAAAATVLSRVAPEALLTRLCGCVMWAVFEETGAIVAVPGGGHVGSEDPRVAIGGAQPPGTRRPTSAAVSAAGCLVRQLRRSVRTREALERMQLAWEVAARQGTAGPISSGVASVAKPAAGGAFAGSGGGRGGGGAWWSPGGLSFAAGLAGAPLLQATEQSLRVLVAAVLDGGERAEDLGPLGEEF